MGLRPQNGGRTARICDALPQLFCLTAAALQTKKKAVTIQAAVRKEV